MTLPLRPTPARYSNGRSHQHTGRDRGLHPCDRHLGPASPAVNALGRGCKRLFHCLVSEKGAGALVQFAVLVRTARRAKGCDCGNALLSLCRAARTASQTACAGRSQRHGRPRLSGCPGFVRFGRLATEESTIRKTRAAYTPEFRRQMVELVHAGRSPEVPWRELEPTAQSIRYRVAQSDRDTGRGDGGLRIADRPGLDVLLA